MTPENPTPDNSTTEVSIHEISILDDSQIEDSGTETSQAAPVSLSVNEGADPTLMSEYQFIVNLLSRQDEVLKGLDELNERVLTAIEEISAQRQAEILAQNPKAAKSAEQASAAPATNEPSEGLKKAA